MKHWFTLLLWSVALLTLATGCGSKSEEGPGKPDKPGTEQPDPEKPNPENPDPEQPEEPPFVPPTLSLVGEWGLIEWQGHSELVGKIYVRFGSDGRFTLYQNIDTQGFTQFRGTYECVWNNDAQAILLTGEYIDGSALGDIYRAEKSEDGRRIQLTAMRSGEVSIYEQTEIPSWVKQPSQASRTNVEPCL